MQPPGTPSVDPPANPGSRPLRLLITAGPTHEPIDDVRYIANRSSGRLGVALADAAAERGHHTTLLLGPTHLEPSHTHVTLHRFRTTTDLQRLLDDHFPSCDVLVMAAAVADYRPHPPQGPSSGSKIRRTPDALTLRLEPTPDLLAACAARKRPHQRLIGFALEPRDRLDASARDKLERKRLDAIIANPLETMDADTIEATLLARAGDTHSTHGLIPKADFATWLLDHIEAIAAAP